MPSRGIRCGSPPPAWSSSPSSAPPIGSRAADLSGTWAVDQAAWDMQLERILAAMLARMPPEAAAQMKAAGVDPAASFKEAAAGGLDATVEFLPGGVVRQTSVADGTSEDKWTLRATTCGGGRRRRRARGHGRQGRRRPDHAAPHSSRATTPTWRSCERWSIRWSGAPSSTPDRGQKRPPSRVGRQSLRGTMRIAPLGKRTSAALSSASSNFLHDPRRTVVSGLAIARRAAPLGATRRWPGQRQPALAGRPSVTAGNNGLLHPIKGRAGAFVPRASRVYFRRTLSASDAARGAASGQAGAVGSSCCGRMRNSVSWWRCRRRTSKRKPWNRKFSPTSGSGAPRRSAGPPRWWPRRRADSSRTGGSGRAP